MNDSSPPRGWRLWLLAARPRTLPLAVVPVLVGSALGWAEGGRGAFHAVPFVLALAVSALIQIGTNLLNDVDDFERGADRPARLGPQRVTAQGWATPRQVKRAALTCFLAVTASGIYLTAFGGLPIILIGAAGVLAGWSYSRSPWPISYSATGEAFVFLFFGLAAVGGSAWLQNPAFSPAALVAGAALGLMAAAVLMVNNTRDMEEDRQAGRRTLAIRMGLDGARMVYAILMLAPYLMLALLGQALPLLSLPLAVWLVMRFRRETPGPAFNGLLARTAQAQALFGLLLALALV
ncbi:MAG: 1,4-dihydroxy-2-naphthoate polyprenyltransferase [Magnetospirillum sp. WYHS-4]